MLLQIQHEAHAAWNQASIVCWVKLITYNRTLLGLRKAGAEVAEVAAPRQVMTNECELLSGMLSM